MLSQNLTQLCHKSFLDNVKVSNTGSSLSHATDKQGPRAAGQASWSKRESFEDDERRAIGPNNSSSRAPVPDERHEQSPAQNRRGAIGHELIKLREIAFKKAPRCRKFQAAWLSVL